MLLVVFLLAAIPVLIAVLLVADARVAGRRRRQRDALLRARTRSSIDEWEAGQFGGAGLRSTTISAICERLAFRLRCDVTQLRAADSFEVELAHSTGFLGLSDDEPMERFESIDLASLLTADAMKGWKKDGRPCATLGEFLAWCETRMASRGAP